MKKIITFFLAARWAGLYYNEQPWRFVYAMQDDQDHFNNLLDCIVEGNKL